MHRSALQYRLNYGLRLWQWGFSGSCNFAYQWLLGQNRWDSLEALKLGCTLPVSQGEPVPTTKWETMREANDDLRYLSTLLDCLDTRKKAHRDDPVAKTTGDWLAHLYEGDQLVTETKSIQDHR